MSGRKGTYRLLLLNSGGGVGGHQLDRAGGLLFDVLTGHFRGVLLTVSRVSSERKKELRKSVFCSHWMLNVR
jgi:hypothetical protein